MSSIFYFFCPVGRWLFCLGQETAVDFASLHHLHAHRSSLYIHPVVVCWILFCSFDALTDRETGDDYKCLLLTVHAARTIHRGNVDRPLT